MNKRSKKIRNKSTEPPTSLPVQPPALSLFQSLRKILKSWWARAVALLAFLLTLFSLYDTYLQTLPDVHPNGHSSDGSSYALPFSIKNRSAYFAMSGIMIHCEYNIVTWDLHNEKTEIQYFRAHGTMITASKQSDVHIPPGESVNFPCDASEAAKASIEGRQLPIIEIRMRINMDYHTHVLLVSVPRKTFMSTWFIWKKAGSGFQWFEGDIIQ